MQRSHETRFGPVFNKKFLASLQGGKLMTALPVPTISTYLCASILMYAVTQILVSNTQTDDRLERRSCN